MSPAASGIAALVAAAGLLAFGYLLVSALPAARRLGGTTRAAMAFPALAAWVLVLMVLHMLSGGRVLSSPWLVRAVTLGTAAVLLFLRMRSRETPGVRDRGWVVALGAVALGLAIWGSPVFRMLALDHTGDTNLHTGWTAQLLNGETTPSGSITGDIPNFYPWLSHAISSFVAAFVPGGTSFHALPALHLLLVTSSVPAFFALGREVAGSRLAGWTTALFASLAGGIGYLTLRTPDVVLDPRADEGRAAMRYLGDLLFKRSYNMSFNNLSPPFPRDIALVLLASFLVVLVLALRDPRPSRLAAAGVTLGMTGLSGGETFFLGLGVAAVAPFVAMRVSRVRTASWILLPAGAVFALWALPLVINYVRLGFVNITVVGPVDLPLLGVLGSWGIVTPLAAYGAWRWVPRAREKPEIAVVVSVAAVAAAMLICAAAVPRLLGEAFLTIGRRHRYWPLVHLGLAIFGGLALADLAERISRGRRRWGAALVAGATVLAIPSPLAASVALPRKLEAPEMLSGALAGERGNLLTLLAPRPGMRCNAAVPLELGVRVFAFTGYRLVMYVWSAEYETNKPRLRWRRIWSRIVAEQERIRDNAVLTSARGDPAAWRSLAKKYRVHRVVVPAAAVDKRALRGLPVRRASGSPYAVVTVSDCAA